MGKAEEAFEEAKRRIAVAKREGAERLDLSLRELRRIPEEIGELTGLTELDLTNTSPGDLSSISALRNLQRLVLYRADVNDLSAVSALKSLNRLDLSGSTIGRHGLFSLGAMERLVAEPGPAGQAGEIQGLTFSNCAATQMDRTAATISRLVEPSERARALFEYLGMPVSGEEAQPYVEDGYVEEGYVADDIAPRPTVPEQSESGLRYLVGPSGLVEYDPVATPFDATAQ